jgi:hypothetical protein
MSTPRTKRPELRIDRRDGATLAGGAIVESGGSPASPGVTIPGPPEWLKVTGSALLNSSLVPEALVNLEWRRPATPGPIASYLVQWSLNSSFTSPTGIPRTPETPQTPVITAAISPVPAGVTVWFRVAAIAAGGVQGTWSVATSTLTPADTTPPAAPTSLITSWSGLTGDLDLRWTNPASANFSYVRIRIYASNGGALLRTDRSVAARFTWSKAMQYLDTAGAFDPSVYVELHAVSIGGTLSTTALTGTATLAAPSAPAGLTSSWAGDTGTAGANCRITWTASSAVASYRLSIDGVSVGREAIVGGGYDYSFDLNRAEHGGTADPALSLSLVAVDALGQASTAATQTATNAAPPATTISAFGAFTMVGLTITASAAQDFQDYRVRVYKAAVLVRTLFVTATNTTYVIEDGDGNYTFDVAVRDRFGQIGAASSQTVPVELVDQGDFIADLRAGLSYQDSIATAPETLNGLKDDNTGTNVVTYASSASAWRWTEGIRALEVRHRKTTLSISASASFYYGVSLDGATYTWYAGGTATGGVWSPVVQVSEAAARTAATVLSAGVWRISLAATVEGRYFRLGHRNTTTSYALREFYPRSLVEADDINVESLSAISANLGAVTAGTITGLTIQTATTGARVVLDSSGLKTYNSAGTLITEATTATGGAVAVYGGGANNLAEALKFYANVGDPGAIGYVGLTDGIMHVASTSFDLSFSSGYNPGTDTYLGGGNLTLFAAGASSGAAAPLVALQNYTSFGVTRRMTLVAGYGLRVADFDSGTSRTVNEGDIELTGGLNVGAAASGATEGQILATISTATTGGVVVHSALAARSTGTAADGFGGSLRLRLESSTTNDRDAGAINWSWTTAADASRKARLALFAFDNTTAREGLRIESNGSAPLLGFYGAGAVARPTVTGSRGGNAALASLLTALAGQGLITDSSSA